MKNLKEPSQKVFTNLKDSIIIREAAMNILRNLQMSFLGTNGSGKHLFNISPGSLQKPCQISAKIVCSDLARIYTTVISQNLIKSLLTDSTRIRQCFEQ